MMCAKLVNLIFVHIFKRKKNAHEKVLNHLFLIVYNFYTIKCLICAQASITIKM
jgi:hypothetical protein